MSFLVKYGRYSVAQFFKTSEVRRALAYLYGTGGGGGGTVTSISGINPIDVDSSNPAIPQISIREADGAQVGIVSTSDQRWKGIKRFDEIPTTTKSVMDYISGDQLVSKDYVDTFLFGITIKESVVAASYQANTSILSWSTGQTVDTNVVLGQHDRVLAKDEPNPIHNGVYLVTPTGLARAADMYTGDTCQGGTTVTVLGGATNANTQWAQTNSTPVVDTDPLLWTKLGIASSVISVAGKTGTVSLVKADVGLSNVDNTSDLNKPISTATQAALDLKLSLSDIANSAASSILNPSVVLTADRVMVTSVVGRIYESSITTTQLGQLSSLSTTYAPINNASFTGTFSAPSGTITSAMILDGTIVNGDISATAAIAPSKISGTALTLADITSDIKVFLGTNTSANLAAAVSDETGSGALVFGTQPTLSQPSINNIRSGYTSTVTSNSTLAISATSTYQQYFSGTADHILQLPNTSTLAVGQGYEVRNDSTGTITVQTYTGAEIQKVFAKSVVKFVCKSTSINTALAWDYFSYGSSVMTIKSASGSASYSFVASDASNVFIQHSFGTLITATIPSGTFPTGSIIYGTQSGVGQVTFVATSGSIISANSALKTRVQYSSYMLVCVDSATNKWQLIGDLTI